MLHSNKKSFKGIDIFKFIMAIIVVAIHTEPFKAVNESIFVYFWNLIKEIAVPYFFVASGFFLFSKVITADNKTAKLIIIKQYTIKIIKLYIYWTLIFLPISIWHFTTDNLPFAVNILDFIRGVLFLGEYYYSWPLWYLLSLIYSLMTVYFLIARKVKINLIFIISIFFYLIPYLINYMMNIENTDNMVLLLKKIIHFAFDSGHLFQGMLYIMTGALIASIKLQFKTSFIFIILIISLLFQFIHFVFISKFMLVVLITTIFYLSMNINIKRFKHTYFFRKSSTVIYFTHMIVFFIYTLLFKGFKYFGWDAFFISTLLPIALTPLILKYEKMSILKKIF